MYCAPSLYFLYLTARSTERITMKMIVAMVMRKLERTTFCRVSSLKN